jgi:hypothetical protein
MLHDDRLSRLPGYREMGFERGVYRMDRPKEPESTEPIDPDEAIRKALDGYAPGLLHFALQPEIAESLTGILSGSTVVGAELSLLYDQTRQHDEEYHYFLKHASEPPVPPYTIPELKTLYNRRRYLENLEGEDVAMTPLGPLAYEAVYSVGSLPAVLVMLSPFDEEARAVLRGRGIEDKATSNLPIGSDLAMVIAYEGDLPSLKLYHLVRIGDTRFSSYTTNRKLGKVVSFHPGIYSLEPIVVNSPRKSNLADYLSTLHGEKPAASMQLTLERDKPVVVRGSVIGEDGKSYKCLQLPTDPRSLRSMIQALEGRVLEQFGVGKLDDALCQLTKESSEPKLPHRVTVPAQILPEVAGRQ